MNPYDAGSGGPAGKLIRNRSTKANDDWWRSVQDAAKTAPKLTYERSAPMANEDVLDRYRKWVAKHADNIPRIDFTEEGCSVAVELAAEVRELRKDRERLEHVLSLKMPGGYWARYEIDAAMKPPGGENTNED